MALADAIQTQAKTSVFGVRCNAGKMISAMPEADAKALVSALDSELNSSVIHKALVFEGYTVSYHSLHRHRRRKCHCVR